MKKYFRSWIGLLLLASITKSSGGVLLFNYTAVLDPSSINDQQNIFPATFNVPVNLSGSFAYDTSAPLISDDIGSNTYLEPALGISKLTILGGGIEIHSSFDSPADEIVVQNHPDIDDRFQFNRNLAGASFNGFSRTPDISIDANSAISFADAGSKSAVSSQDLPTEIDFAAWPLSGVSIQIKGAGNLQTDFYAPLTGFTLVPESEWLSIAFFGVIVVFLVRKRWEYSQWRREN